jgi:putative acetyltransferase
MPDAPNNALPTIFQAANSRDIESVKTLFQEYADSLGIDLAFQQFAKELAELPGKYTPPSGRLLLAMANNQPAGCVALRPLGGDICEMKRLYVRPLHRGTGLGRTLAHRIIEEAKTAGYARMRLDTIPSLMTGAVCLYHTLGFANIPAYCDNPVSGAMFMELQLLP